MVFSFSESLLEGSSSGGVNEGPSSATFDVEDGIVGGTADDTGITRESLDFLLTTDFLPRVPTGTGFLPTTDVDDAEPAEVEPLIDPGREATGLSLAGSTIDAFAVLLPFGVPAVDRTLRVLPVVLAIEDTLAPEIRLARSCTGEAPAVRTLVAEGLRERVVGVPRPVLAVR